MYSVLSIVIVLIVSTISIEGKASGSNCGSGNTIQLVNFNLTPDPIKVPGSTTPNTATFDLDVQLTQDIVHPIKTAIVLETKVLFFWVEAPCENNVGSCTYPSFCEFCKTCSCPEKAGSHRMTIPMNITSVVPKGDYQANIRFTSATGQTGCVDITDIVLN